MVNGTQDAPSSEVKEEEVTEVPVNTGSQLIGGEVHILADGKTGGINVKAPQNLAVALGLIELAKVVLVQQHLDLMRAADQVKPAIVRAQPDDVRKLVRPS